MTYTVSVRIDVDSEAIDSGSDAVTYVEERIPDDEAFETVSISV